MIKVEEAMNVLQEFCYGLRTVKSIIILQRSQHKCLVRYASVNAEKKRKHGKEKKAKVGFVDRPDPNLIDKDYIGPPDPLSNLRPIVRCIRKDETPLANRLRLKQIEVEKWNQEFWAKHNERFITEKEDFIRLHKLSSDEEISADKMSRFYKDFLDKNHKVHTLYNLSWYIKNYEMCIMSFQLHIQNLFRKLKRRS